MKNIALASLLFLSVVSPDARAFTLGGSDPDLVGWQTKELTFAVNYTGCTVSTTVMDAGHPRPSTSEMLILSTIRNGSMKNTSSQT